MSLSRVRSLSALLLLACAADPASLLAAETGPARTAFFYVPLKGVLAISPQVLGTVSSPFESTSNGAVIADSRLRQETLAAAVDYGLLRTLSVGILGQYRWLEVTTTGRGAASRTHLRSAGFSDTAVYARGLHSLGPITLLGSLTVGLSPGRGRSATAAQDGNQCSGGNTLQPLLGAQAEIRPGHFLGVRTSYLKRFRRRVEAGGALRTLSGGDDFELATAYYERRRHPWMADVALGVDRVRETETDGTLSASGYTAPTAQLRGYLTVSRRVILIAGYGAQRVPGVPAATSSTGATGYWLHTVGLAARILLYLP